MVTSGRSQVNFGSSNVCSGKFQVNSRPPSGRIIYREDGKTLTGVSIVNLRSDTFQ